MQRIDLTTVTIIDVETPCWERSPPAGQEQEIIEIGLCTPDGESAAPLEHEGLLVKPQRCCAPAGGMLMRSRNRRKSTAARPTAAYDADRSPIRRRRAVVRVAASAGRAGDAGPL